MDILTVNNVTKAYSNHKALDNVSLKVNEGEIFGLLGPNGAGKTTLIRMINQITAPDSGEILLYDHKIKASDITLIGYLPEERGLYKKMKVGEQAIYLAELKGLKPSVAQKKLKAWFEKFDISSWWDKKVEELSKGMQQKVQFITTVLHEPKLLIFDEPFSGFDPINTNLLKEEIIQLQANGATIIFSTHNMESVEEICDSIVLINKAEKILEGQVKDIKQRFKHNEYEVVTPADDYSMESLLPSGCQLIRSEINSELRTSILTIEKGRNAELLSRILTITDIISYRELLPSMNDIFIKTVKNYE
ncbi:MAG: ATP-binding cassette domain-containing protein [Bacteroidales bacterium]|jgi:ABC-2 type transport system ATP-binding protein|nr:ATP-binding cassette domain-containing protein [Bacteroidales bacterium]